MEPSQNNFFNFPLPVAALVKNNPTCNVFNLSGCVIVPYRGFFFKNWKVTIVNHTDFNIILKDHIVWANNRMIYVNELKEDHKITFYCLDGFPTHLCHDRINPQKKCCERFSIHLDSTKLSLNLPDLGTIEVLSSIIQKQRIQKFKNDFSLILKGYEDKDSYFNTIPKDIISHIASLYAGIIKFYG